MKEMKLGPFVEGQSFITSQFVMFFIIKKFFQKKILSKKCLEQAIYTLSICVFHSSTVGNTRQLSPLHKFLLKIQGFSNLVPRYFKENVSQLYFLVEASINPFTYF